jgi:hypothetical protein
VAQILELVVERHGDQGLVVHDHDAQAAHDLRSSK